MNKKPTLHFLCGKMASGKSTLARSLAKENNAVIISEDIWLSQLYSEEINNFQDYLKYSSRLKAILSQHIQHLLLQGVSIILDFPGNTPRQRNWFRSIFESVEANHLLHYVDASNELCKQQLKIRSKDKPEGSAFTTEAEFEAITKYFQPPTPEEGFNIKIYRRNSRTNLENSI
ncbi:MAG: ATP-binding protein [Nostocaceae cyanobacterium]|nr:ATP-binding protein [Nostocaceae cyanobacterium]